jgi:hypothetical protein
MKSIILYIILVLIAGNTLTNISTAEDSSWAKLSEEEKEAISQYKFNKIAHSKDLTPPLYRLRVGASMGTYSLVVIGTGNLGEMTMNGRTTSLNIDTGVTIDDFTYSVGLVHTTIEIDKNPDFVRLPESIALNRYFVGVGYKAYTTNLTWEFGMRELPGVYINQNYQVEVAKAPLPYTKLKITERALEGLYVGGEGSYMVGSATSKMGVLHAYSYGVDVDVDLYKNPLNAAQIKGTFGLNRTVTREIFSKDTATETVLGVMIGF